ETLRVPRVLPRLVREAARSPPLVLHEAVAVAVAVRVDPRERGERRLPEPLDERGVVHPPPGLRDEHDEERSGIDAAVVAREPGGCGPAVANLVHDLPRL